MTTFERIKKIANKKGYSSLRLLSEKSGLGANAIYQWRNKTPRIDSLQKVANVLGVSVDYLLGNTDEMLPNKKAPSEPEPMDNSVEGIKARLVSYDGSPVTDHDAKLIKQYLDTLFEGRE